MLMMFFVKIYLLIDRINVKEFRLRMCHRRQLFGPYWDSSIRCSKKSTNRNVNDIFTLRMPTPRIISVH